MLQPFRPMPQSRHLAWPTRCYESARGRSTHTSRVQLAYSGWTAEGSLIASTKTDRTGGHRGQMTLSSPKFHAFTEGVQLMVEGDVVRFWIPQDRYYRTHRGDPGTVVFDVELVKIIED